MFTEQDIHQIQLHGQSVKLIENQLENFKKGFPYLNIQSAATVENGILKLSEKDLEHYIQLFEESLTNRKLMKFVPASGAASRMFKQLFEFEANYTGVDEEYKRFVADKGLQSMYNFFKKLDSFAFFQDLKKTCDSTTEEIEEILLRKEFKRVLKKLLYPVGLNYGKMPKGLLKFHTYKGKKSRTPVEEHLVEAAYYAKNEQNKANLHFTISPEHKEGFEALLAEVKQEYEEKLGVEFSVDFSEQKPKTDMIAADLNNEPFRNTDGTLLFRPGGHGALIENLNDLDADLIFVKNIDNVVPDRLKKDTVDYKKALAGKLIELQIQIFDFVQKLKSNPGQDEIQLAEEFLINKLFTVPSKEYANFSIEQKRDFLLKKLNRPTRVCGMVKNEGEPGGGPFWAQNSDETVSLQIVESSQIDPDSKAANNIVAGATHFNPVDLVCATKNCEGEKFNLLDFVDLQTGFVSEKSKDGNKLKAQELPGLWNGAMSDWNTVFVEVPISTFNPVKTVNDLLREQHQ